ncbi:MAG TPA: hypothetical protein DF613_09990 [Lachnospiraceae bacterium]|nr:hypothetical protein [Lachnospiraceae bacterium]
MKNKTCTLFTLSALLCAGCLAGQNAMAMTVARDGRIIQFTEAPGPGSVSVAVQNDVCEAVETTDDAAIGTQNDFCEAVETTDNAVTETQIDFCEAAETIDDAAEPAQKNACETTETAGTDRTAFEKRCKLYEPFGMTYDADKNELRYNKKLVRWFEDYYPTGDDGKTGIEFFNEKGTVDVYAVRDLNNITRRDDGSFDPGGRLTGLEEFSEKEFNERDIKAIKNPPTGEAVAGDPVDAREMEKIAAEYKAFGVTYDADSEQWYYKGKKVRYFLDVLTSNGKSLNGGEFKGDVRMYNGDEGTVAIYTVRDFGTPNADGNGTLTAVKTYGKRD